MGAAKGKPSVAAPPSQEPGVGMSVRAGVWAVGRGFALDIACEATGYSPAPDARIVDMGSRCGVLPKRDEDARSSRRRVRQEPS